MLTIRTLIEPVSIAVAEKKTTGERNVRKIRASSNLGVGEGNPRFLCGAIWTSHERK
jgi:hypothetical protein